MIYHVLNRAAGRTVFMRSEKDFQAFQRILIHAHEREPLPILAYCLMGNHWHFVVHQKQQGQMARFFRWLTLTHAVRWRVAHKSVGEGPLYQGRFKSFPVQRGGRMLEVLRYVERNALSAGLVKGAEEWPWSSLYVRAKGPEELRKILSSWPGGEPSGWLDYVNEPITPRELERLEVSERRGRPYGEERWVLRTVKEHGLEFTVRSEGRPRKE